MENPILILQPGAGSAGYSVAVEEFTAKILDKV
jgi:hypothetical protein